MGCVTLGEPAMEMVIGLGSARLRHRRIPHVMGILQSALMVVSRGYPM